MSIDSMVNKAGVLIELCKRQRLKLTFAESCTGGLLSSIITNIPGASEVFVGAAVTYANEAKRDVIGVSEEALRQYGAVSEPVARAMAQGVCSTFTADVAASITGIAGPSGGSEEKPVGTVHIGISVRGTVMAHHYVFKGDRQAVRQQSAEKAIDLLIEALT